ncbi:hypothetical protein [Robiginitalea marina]|uniref:Lipoprotein n=1 Tax=Robiginitalea marina TaxID=2954105 RepID=A0ABT1AYK9_9FLAO|nr:hypothetical protein [Robiginitalea marina]MCO5725004.1 hypothetical protein [Robiginitalea marina]
MKYQSLIFLLLFISCKSPRGLTSDISVKTYQARNKYGFPSLVVKCYDFDFRNKRSAIPAYVIVNDIVFEPKVENDSIKETVIRPTSNSKLDIKISFIGKKTIVINNFKILPKDSVVLDVFMKDSDEVLY